MTQTTQVRGVATSIFTEFGYTKIVYHNTIVVKFNERETVLNSGGWRTVTTKTRMNQAASQFGLGYSVFQRKGDWYVEYQGKTVDFVDGMTIERKKEPQVS